MREASPGPRSAAAGAAWPSGEQAAAPPGEAAGQLQPVLARLAALLERALRTEPPLAAALDPEAAPAEAAAWRPPALSDAVLQQLRFSAPRSGAGVAYRVLAGQVHALETGLLLAAGARVSFDTYLNGFYEHYWSTHAPVEDLRLRLFGSGAVVVEAFRALPDGSSYRIGRQGLRLDREGGAVATAASDLSPAGAGRLFFEVAAPAGASVLAGRLETGTAPVRPVRIGIGLCTFNREGMLLSNLRRLVRSPYWRWGLPRVVVVNQGRGFASEGMAALLAAERDRIAAVEQPNLGGAGGFTRAAMEILRGGGQCSHVLFMDDDIDFDPDVLVTTHAFAARATRPTVVGGAMVDLFRPATMYEAGAVVGADNVLRAVLHNRSLEEPGTLSDLAREVPCHFNGWWYCAIPAAAFREHGLPLPLFIRGDDMEYGVRLMQGGVPTVSLPPVAVWHEPFYAKPPGWQLYYDLRNRLIFAACHPSLVRLDRVGVVLRRLVDSLLKHDYMHAELVIRAVEDFLAGPAVLDAPADALHREISALAAAHAPSRPTSAVGMMPARWRPPPRRAWRAPTLLLGLAALRLGLARRRPRPDLVFVDQWHPWMTMWVSQYGLSDRMNSYVQLYRHDRAKLRSALRRGLAVALRYRREAAGAAARWRAAQGDLASWARWERVLGLAPAVQPGADAQAAAAGGSGGAGCGRRGAAPG
jgi:galactofuranosylgalactofuranosylrhamnosyl-N-acetylglucosaminyl-diphospho-decaprenol beta-1,5/1,6-galactofuranosyltransferase